MIMRQKDVNQTRQFITPTSSTSTSLFFMAVSQKLGTPFSTSVDRGVFSSAGLSSVLSLGAPSTSISPFTIWYRCTLKSKRLFRNEPSIGNLIWKDMAKIYDHYEYICCSSFLSTPKYDGGNYKYIIGGISKKMW
jgi:hypothetical protein